MILRLIVFLILNFGALAIGSLFTGSGVNSDWYSSLNKAPWTPPGWVFGFAWTTIMIAFTIFMAVAYKQVSDKKLLIILFVLQWILNISWNPLFFQYRQVLLALIVIITLTIVVAWMIIEFRQPGGYWTLLLLPYFLWLLIASSLNVYILIRNN